MSSSFSWFCWQMRRDRSLLILYAAVLICLFPLLSLALQDLGNTPFMFIELVFVPMACMFILSFCLPAHLFSHLWNKRELDMYSSIPLKRSTMFCIRYAAGLCWLLVPITVIIALECLVLFLMHMPPYDMLHMLQSTAELMVLSVLVYSLNVWIAIHCRNRSDALVMSIAYLLVPLIVVLGLYTIISSSIYDVSVGYSSSMQMSLLTDNELVRWLVNLICAPISYGMICAEGFGSAIGSLEGVICLPQYIWIVWLMESVLLIVWSHRAYITMPGEESGQRTTYALMYPLMTHLLTLGLFLYAVDTDDTAFGKMLFVAAAFFFLLLSFIAQRQVRIRLRQLIALPLLAVCAFLLQVSSVQTSGFGLIQELIPADAERYRLIITMDQYEEGQTVTLTTTWISAGKDDALIEVMRDFQEQVIDDAKDNSDEGIEESPQTLDIQFDYASASGGGNREYFLFDPDGSLLRKYSASIAQFSEEEHLTTETVSQSYVGS